ncbi:MAG: MBL fold metallo-hydrolase [Blastomonas sp.]
MDDPVSADPLQPEPAGDEPAEARRDPPAYDASLADHGMEAQEFKGLTYPLGEHAPDYGDMFELAPGIGWTRLPVPGALGHINIWLLDDEDEAGPGVAIVDTGLFIPESIAAWKQLFANGLNGRRITRIIVTHYHPDHIGSAGWLCNRFKVPLWMNRTEWLMARMLTSDIREEPPREAIEQMRFAGWEDDRLQKMREGGWGNFARVVSRLPIGHRRIDDGSEITTGSRRWQAITGGGHTPEHVSLLDRAGSVIISGDQILPRITSNVSVMMSEPFANPLGEWLDGIARFRETLSGEELVLPAHGYPFTGVHKRLDALAAGHHERLDSLEQALREKPLRAVDCFGILFARAVDDSVFGIATGEAMAHLRYLEHAGRARHVLKDGMAWYSAG